VSDWVHAASAAAKTAAVDIGPRRMDDSGGGRAGKLA
jgi:hypothetical protein